MEEEDIDEMLNRPRGFFDLTPITAPAERPRKKGQREKRNGAFKPNPETLGGQIWAELDILYRKGLPATPGEIKELISVKNWNRNNVLTEHNQYKIFYGLSARFIKNNKNDS